MKPDRDRARVIFFGVSGDIGRAAARLISALGGHPILASRSSDRLEDVRGDLADSKNASAAAFDYLDATEVGDGLPRAPPGMAL